MAYVNHEQRAVVDGIDRAHQAACGAQRELLRHIVAANRHQVWQRDGARDVAEWIAGRLGISKWTAHRWAAAATALESLPCIATAFEAGELCIDKVCELTRLATPETEKALLKWAKRVVVSTIRKRADAAETVELHEANEVDRRRELHCWFEGSSFGFQGYLAAEEGAIVAAALDRVADNISTLPTDDGYDPAATSRADALVALASQRLAEDGDADRATVVVHTSLEGLLDGSRTGELEAGGNLHPDIVRRLACDARIELVVEDESRGTIGIGRAARDVPPWMMRQLRRRDRTCTFPGCGSRRWLEAHHIIPWENGGPTELDNLGLVCKFHHKLVHNYGWKLELDEAHVARWFRSDGTRYAPEPVRRNAVDRAPPLEPVP